MIVKRVLMSSSVPLAIFASCQTGQQQAAEQTPGASVVSAPAQSTFASRSVDPEATLSQLQAAGLSEAQSQKWLAYSQCASGGNAFASDWKHGSRRTGVFLIPDSKMTACGYSSLKLWQFRARMHQEGANTRCAAQLARLGWKPDGFERCQENSRLALGDSQGLE